MPRKPKSKSLHVSGSTSLEEGISSEASFGENRKENDSSETKTVESTSKSTQTQLDGYFFAGIGCGYAFRNLIETLLRFAGSGLFIFREDGFHYKNVQADKRCIVEISFPAEYLNNYLFEGNKEITFSLNMEDFHRKIKDIRVQQMLRIFKHVDDEDISDSTRKVNKKKFMFQVCENEEADISSIRYILFSYSPKIDADIPYLSRKPDRVITHDCFMKMGETFKIEDYPHIIITKKEFKFETVVSFEVEIENKSSGAATILSNPSVFAPDEDDEPTISTVKLPKNIFDKFSNSAKFNKDGIVCVYIEDKKYALFEFSFSYVSFLRILVKDVDASEA